MCIVTENCRGRLIYLSAFFKLSWVCSATMSRKEISHWINRVLNNFNKASVDGAILIPPSVINLIML